MIILFDATDLMEESGINTWQIHKERLIFDTCFSRNAVSHLLWSLHRWFRQQFPARRGRGAQRGVGGDPPLGRGNFDAAVGRGSNEDAEGRRSGSAHRGGGLPYLQLNAISSFNMDDM